VADYMAGHIKIGGKVSRAKVAGLLEKIRDERAGLEYGDGEFVPSAVEDLVNATKNGVICLFDDQARYGCFEMESWLKENEVAYDRHSDGLYEYDAEEVYFRPGHEIVSRFATQDGNETIHRDAAALALRLLREGKIEEGIAALEEVVGPEVEKLEPFMIVD
jgi:hypothetical protein